MPLLDQLPPPRTLPAVRLRAARRQLESIASGSSRTWPWRLSRGVTTSLGLSIAIVGGAVAAATIPGNGPPTVGPIPGDAQLPNGGIDLSKVPDFVPDLSRQGQVVGYSPKQDLFPQSTPTVVVPNVVGMTSTAAFAAMKVVGLYATSESEKSGTVPDGNVMSQVPGPGVKVQRRSQVTIISSVGPDGTPSTSGASPYVGPTPGDMTAQNARLIVPVYGRDLKTLVGYMYPGKGFVPLGESPHSVPDLPQTTGTAPSPAQS